MFSQRTSGDFNDISSASDSNRGYSDTHTSMTTNYGDSSKVRYSSKFPRQTNQASLSFPLGFDPTNLSLAFTEVRYDNSPTQKWKQDNSRILSASLNRSVFKRGFAYISAFKELGSDRKGIFAGFTYSFNDKYSASLSSSTNSNKTSVSSSLNRSISDRVGDYGWSLRDMEGDNKNRGASGQYRSRFAEFSGSVEQSDNDNYNASANIDGAIVVADKSVFLSNSIYDSFAVADVGAPNVMVTSQNQPYGKTGRNGKILVSNLISYVPNHISVDPTSLPPDVVIESSSVSVIPADQSGVIAKFGAKGTDEYYIVTLLDSTGKFIPAGALAVSQSSSFNGVVGYDGQLMVEKSDVEFPAKIKIMDQGLQCWAELPQSMEPGLHVTSNRIVCR